LSGVFTLRGVGFALVGVMVALTVIQPVSVQAQAQEPAPAEKLYTIVEARSDLDEMYRRLQADAFDLYAFTPKSDLDRRCRQIEAGIDRPMTRFDLGVRFQLLAAAAHQGHARVEGVYAAWADYRKAAGKAFSLTIHILAGRVYITRNLSGLADLKPGDRISAIDGEPVSRWLERTRRHISAETAYMADSILDYDFPMYLWVEIGARDSFRLSVKPAKGPAFDVKLPALTEPEMAANAAGQPPALDLEHPLRDARILANGVGYLRPGPFYNEAAKTGADEWDVAAFRRFIDAAFQDFNAKGVRRLIIDLRGNPGGDSLFSDVMVSWFADRPYQFFSSFTLRASADAVAANRGRIEDDAAAAGPISQRFAALYAATKPGEIAEFTLPPSLPNPTGKFHGAVFALIDRQTYSNAVAVAATIQDEGFGKILGQPTADTATTFGAMEHFTLPVTGLVVGFPKARIVRPNGDRRSRGVMPDRAIRFPIGESPEDAVLQSAARIAGG
jgi:hypothetical protein